MRAAPTLTNAPVVGFDVFQRIAHHPKQEHFAARVSEVLVKLGERAVAKAVREKPFHLHRLQRLR